MSQTRITLPITLKGLDSIGASVKPVSVTEWLKNPDTVRHRYTYPEAMRYGPFDPWDLLEEFLTCSVEDWEGFILMAGSFGGVFITKNDFKEWQQLLKRALVLPARKWKTLAGEFDPKKVSKLRMGLPIQFDFESEPPTATLLGLTSLGTMIAAIQLDKLQGAEFRVCARPDCKSPPFKVGTRQKIYCSPECAHVVAVRNSRTRAAGAKPVRKPKPRKQTRNDRRK